MPLVTIENAQETFVTLNWKVDNSSQFYNITVFKGSAVHCSYIDKVIAENPRNKKFIIGSLEPGTQYLATVCSISYDNVISPLFNACFTTGKMIACLLQWFRQKF